MRKTDRAAWALLTLFLASLRGACAQSPFTDVPAGHPAAAAVNELARQGLISGYADGSYGGNRAMTRYEVAVVLARILDYPRHRDFVPFVMPPLPPSGRLLTDAPKDHWAADAVQAAHEWGLLHGRPDGRFDGERVITRAEFAAVLQRLHDYLVRFVELNTRGSLR